MLPSSSPCIFDPTPCVQVSHTRVSRWVTMDMWPLDRGMTAPRFDRVFVQDICAGKFLPDIEKFPFRDPDVFIAGQLHQPPEIWEQVAASGSYDRADEVLDWLKHKVFLAKFFKPFMGILKALLKTWIFRQPWNLETISPVMVFMTLFRKLYSKEFVTAQFLFGGGLLQ